MKVKLDNRADTKTIEIARTKVRLALSAIREISGRNVNWYGIAMFDNSPNVRQRLGEMYSFHVPDWFSKTQRTEIKNIKEALEGHQKRIIDVSNRRVIDDFLAFIGTTDITGVKPGQKGATTLKTLASKTPWISADDRTLLPISSRINDFIVSERLVDPNPKTNSPGTTGLIFLDTKQTTANGQPASFNVMNSIFYGEKDKPYYSDFNSNGFVKIMVLNAAGDLKEFRLSSQGTRGMDPKKLKELYAELS